MYAREISCGGSGAIHTNETEGDFSRKLWVCVIGIKQL